jgi:subfamily B ATP-binding cassette protein MsbA
MGTAALSREAIHESKQSAPSKTSPATGERQKPDPHQRRKWRNLFRYASGQVDPDIQSEDASKAPVTRGSLKRFFEFVKPHKTLVLLLCACTLVNQAMIVVMPVAIGRVIDRVLPQHDMSVLNWTAIGLAIFLFARSLFLWCERELGVLVGSLIVRDVRTKLHEHMQTMSLKYLEDYQVGRIVSRIMGDTEAVRNLLIGGFIVSASNALRFVFVLATLFWIDWRLTLISLATLPFFMVGFWFFVRRLRPAYKELSEDGSRLWARASETFSAVRVVKTYRGEKRADCGFTGRVHLILRKTLLICRTHHIIAVIWEGAVWAGLVAMIWYGGRRVMAGEMSAGALVAFYGLIGQVHGPVAELINVSGAVQQAMASIERIGEVLDHKPEIADKPDAIEAPRLSGEVEFDNVSFAYAKKADEQKEGEKQKAEASGEPPKSTLQNISFKVRPGECIALVGPSGSGKSTIINLLARLYDVDSGSVKADGIDIRDYRQAGYRKHLAIVLQENFLFRGTIRENIRYARPDATEEEIVSAAKMAGAWEFISAQAEGLDALCGERGVKLSGGQKQRLSIARAILADPRILILDEATSALDSQSEAHIQGALDTLMKGRTTFIIAHRLSTIVNANRIIVLDKGRIVESGTHEELLLQEGRYFEMFMEQYGRMRFSGRTADAIGRWKQDHQAKPERAGRSSVRTASVLVGGE